MARVVELTRRHLDATVRGDAETLKSLDAELEEARTRKDMLLRLYMGNRAP
jgi:hypothetical protein